MYAITETSHKLSRILLAFSIPLLSIASHAQFTEAESNNTKATANAINIGTATSATITGASTNNSDSDYFKLTTTYTTPGIYMNQLQLSNGTQFIGSLRGLTQSNGSITAGSDPIFQSSQSSGTATPYGFNRFYSFGGAGQTQSMYYKVVSSSASSGGAYTATFSSAVVTPTNIGSFGQGSLSFNALSNIGSSGVATNTSLVVLDSSYNVYYDNVPASSTFGEAATNDNGSSGFSLTRTFAPGTYYMAVGISNVATNQPAAPDDASRSSTVLDFDNTIATANTFYDGNNGNTRPSDFTVSNAYYHQTYTSSKQVIPSLYALNFYSFTVTATPEPNTVLLSLSILAPVSLARLRKRRHWKTG